MGNVASGGFIGAFKKDPSSSVVHLIILIILAKLLGKPKAQKMIVDAEKSETTAQVNASRPLAAPLSLPATEAGVLVRMLEHGDLKAAGAICQEAFNGFNASAGLNPEFPPQEVADVPAMLIGGPFQAPAGHYAVIAALDAKTEEVLGSIVVELRDDVAGIGPITVSPKAQDRGVGKLLMRAAMTKADQAGKKAVRLNQVGQNVKSYSLYLGCGFDPRCANGQYEGVCTAAEEPGFTFEGQGALKMRLEECDALHKKVCKTGRKNDIAAMAEAPVPTGVVLGQDGKVAAYTTGCFLSGHTVAVSEAALRALTVHMSKAVEEVRAKGAPLPPTTFFVPHNYQNHQRWLSMNGYKLARPITSMGYGPYTAPKTADGLYLPAIQY